MPPAVGVANNGDFSKTYGRFNLTEPVADEAKFADTKFFFDSNAHYRSPFYSSEQLFLIPALVLNRIVSKDGTFDLRLIGVVHAALLLYTAWLFPPLLSNTPRPMRLATYILALLIFGDVMYVAYLNSFFMDVAAYLCLLLGTVLFLRTVRWQRMADTILLALCCVVMTTAKAQHAALGFWAALLIGLSLSRNALRVGLFAGCLAVLAIVWVTAATPPEYSLRGCFTMVFYQILPHAKNPDRTAADLGLGSSYRQYIGLHSFSAGSPMDDPRFRAEFSRTISYGTLAWFFLSHPRDTYTALRNSLDDAGRQRPILGNFDVKAGLPPLAESQSFALWSGLKRRLFEHHGSRFLFCSLGVGTAVGVLLFCERRRLDRGAFWGGYALIGMMATELAISSLADAVDVARHHLLFYAIFDLLLIVGVCLVASRFSSHSPGRGYR